MKIESCVQVPDVKIIWPSKLYEDVRGAFTETFNKRDLASICAREFVQDNRATRCEGSLAGLHYQVGEFAQAKLVRVNRGKIYDIAVDLRRDSPTYKRWVGVELSEENRLQIYVPRGFAHGYIVLADAEILYKTDNYYSPEHEAGVRWNCEELNIGWLLPFHGFVPHQSTKDAALPSLAELDPRAHSFCEKAPHC